MSQLAVNHCDKCVLTGWMPRGSVIQPAGESTAPGAEAGLQGASERAPVSKFESVPSGSNRVISTSVHVHL